MRVSTINSLYIYHSLTRSRFDSCLFDYTLNYTIMTVEELKSMTQEDLVRRVQEVEEVNERLTKEKNILFESWSKLDQKFNHFKNAVKSIVMIID